MGVKTVLKIAALIVGGIIVLSLLLASCTTVDTGNRGIQSTFGKVDGKSYPEGLYFVNPFTTDTAQMNIQTRKWEESTVAYTKDIQQATIGFALTYRPTPDKVHLLYQQIGTEWADRIIPQVVQKSVKDEFGRWNAVQVISDRTSVTKNIAQAITESLARSNIIVDGFELTNIDYSDAFEAAVEAKEVAAQNAIREKNNTVGVEERAKQQLISAKATAESMRIRSEALSKNQGLVEYEAVKAWNGQLPLVVSGGSGAILNLPASLFDKPRN